MPRSKKSDPKSHEFGDVMNLVPGQIPSVAKPPEPRGGDVHVWTVSLDIDDSEIRVCEAALSHDEAARGARFVLPIHRTRFVAARGALRTILSRYTGTEPAGIGFSYGPHGKPQLAPAFAPNGIQFNISHAGDRALVAVTKGRCVGIDIELIGTRAYEADIARRFFAPGEEPALLLADESVRAALFAAIWTRKEACVKASGLGLALPLDSFDVSADARAPRIVECNARGNRVRRRWTLVDVETVAGCAAACAVEGTGLNVVREQFRL